MADKPLGDPITDSLARYSGIPVEPSQCVVGLPGSSRHPNSSVSQLNIRARMTITTME